MSPRSHGGRWGTRAGTWSLCGVWSARLLYSLKWDRETGLQVLGSQCAEPQGP